MGLSLAPDGFGTKRSCMCGVGGRVESLWGDFLSFWGGGDFLRFGGGPFVVFCVGLSMRAWKVPRGMFWGCFRHNGCLDVFICVSVFLAAHGGCGGVIPGGVRQRMLQYWAGVFDETMGSVS